MRAVFTELEEHFSKITLKKSLDFVAVLIPNTRIEKNITYCYYDLEKRDILQAVL